RRKVEFLTAIRTTGEFDATVRIGEQVANLKLHVVAVK
ncbi:MAG: hypothetical protein RL718_353, partial [Actinomycetota bacterium]